MYGRTKVNEMKKDKKFLKEEEYLNEIFCVIQKMDRLTVADKKTSFNNLEIRLIGEILSSGYVGKRLISTQLADRLGVTRSAISQIVNKLEERGVVKRVADDVDKKIAYIELTQEAHDAYAKDMCVYIEFVGRVAREFGEERFMKMCSMFNEFYELIETEKKRI